MAEPKWMDAARELVGLKEIVGSRHEPKVVQFFADAGHSWVKDDETAWCAAFVGAMLKKAGIKGTGQLNARSYLTWGQKLDVPRPGCIVIFWRGSKTSWQGHVAFYVSETAKYVKVLGGNQSNAVSIANYSKAQLLGYRWPKEAVEVPAPKPAPIPPPPDIPKAKPAPVQPAKPAGFLMTLLMAFLNSFRRK